MIFSFIDIVFLIIILFMGINATIKGFIHEFFTKTAFFLGLFIAALFFRKLAPFFDPYIKVQVLNLIISFVIIFIAVYLLVRILQQCVKGLLSGEIMNGLDHALGFLFGIAEGFVIICMVLVIFYAQPWFDAAGLLEKSFFHRLLQTVLSAPTEYLRGMVA